MLDRLAAAEERERIRDSKGPDGLWGPDGEDLFEQMARPMQTRVEALLRPVRTELQEIHELATIAAYVHDTPSEAEAVSANTASI